MSTRKFLRDVRGAMNWQNRLFEAQVRERVARDLEALKLYYERNAEEVGAGLDVSRIVNFVLDEAIRVAQEGK